MSAWISSAAACQSLGQLDLARACAARRRAAVGGHPAHDLGRREVLRLAAHLPDAPVRLAPVLERALDLAHEDRPEPLVEAVARLRVQVDRVEHRAPHVVLALLVGGVADRGPAGRPRSRAGGRASAPRSVALAVDAVHDLQVVVALGHVGDEVEEVVGLPVEAERVQRPQRERRVADPAVAVVPVALAAGRLRQRRRGRGDERAGRRERQALQRERAALEVARATDGRGSRRGPASAASGAPSRRAARRPRRRSVGGACSLHDSAQKRVLALLDAACGPSPARPRSRCACRSSASARGRRPAPCATPCVVAVAGVVPLRRAAAVVEHRLAVERRAAPRR